MNTLKKQLPIAIELNGPKLPLEYWERVKWCQKNIGKMLGSDDLLPAGRWFHSGYFTDDNQYKHKFFFADEEFAREFAVKFVFKFLE